MCGHDNDPVSALRRERARFGLERLSLAVVLACLGLLAGTPDTVVGEQTSVSRPKHVPAVQVKDLDVCRAGPQCDYGAIYERFRAWGNVAPESLGDCTFAAAANWEQIVLHLHAQPAAIRDEFEQAGGSRRAGLAQSSLWAYWQDHGIAGVVLASFHRYELDRTDVEDAVRTYTALVVELSFKTHHRIAQFVVSSALHDAVVDGFTPAGPLVVSWGRTLQMTWREWEQEALEIWRIETVNQPPGTVGAELTVDGEAQGVRGRADAR